MDIILYLLGLVVAFVWGYRFREHLATKKMDNLVQRLSQEMEEVKSNVMLVTIEKDTNRFLTQSTNQKELGENLKKMFPNKRFAASHQNMREAGYDESI